ncbi:MAG TPA: GDP-mannose 4,6-dehydratase [Candidatus Solibacter sp.]|jgi:GDPmannose 4,6-dehydratase|nr:GDP-mannose 4,6-dehydratase [Candidatus Solibacter sp.]
MRVLITGITGQDGSYMAEFLLEKGHEVYGLVRRSSLEKYDRIESIVDRIQFVEGDLTDQGSLDAAMDQIQPHEVYNLAAQSFVPVSWNQPVLTADVTGLGVLRMLEAIRKHCPTAKYLQASSSEMFGKVLEKPQTEKTPFHPRSPYGVAKVFAHHITVNYRESYGLFACSSICFNHESPRRGAEFVTRKVTQHAARIKLGLADRLKMGNLDAQRDWGYAGDYIAAMWLMLQQPQPDDYVIATGVTHSIQELLDVAFSYVGLDWKKYVEIDPKLVRPAEVDYLCGDSSKARRVLGWKPKVDFRQLVEMMVDADLTAQSHSATVRNSVIAEM